MNHRNSSLEPLNLFVFHYFSNNTTTQFDHRIFSSLSCCLNCISDRPFKGNKGCFTIFLSLSLISLYWHDIHLKVPGLSSKHPWSYHSEPSLTTQSCSKLLTVHCKARHDDEGLGDSWPTPKVPGWIWNQDIMVACKGLYSPFFLYLLGCSLHVLQAQQAAIN